jgi:hypothetical protein
MLGYTLALPRANLGARVTGCQNRLVNDAVAVTNRELTLSLEVTHAWDLRRLSVSVGSGAGTSLLRQGFEAEGRAPARTSAAPLAYLLGAAALPIRRAWFAAAELRAEGHLFPFQSRATEEPTLKAGFAARGLLALARQW